MTNLQESLGDEQRAKDIYHSVYPVIDEMVSDFASGRDNFHKI